MSALPASAQIDRVAGTRLGTLWALPAFGIVLPAISQTAELGQVSRVAWLVSGALCWLAFACAAVQRSRARALIRALWYGAEQLGAGVVHDGDTFFGDTTVVQYEIRVALLVLDVTLLTAPRKQGGAFIASAITLLLGWWSIPWGPLHTVRALVGNARGGSTRTVAQLLNQVRASSARAPTPWWRAALALDSGDRLKIIGNITVAFFLLLFVGLIGFAIVAAHLGGLG